MKSALPNPQELISRIPEPFQSDLYTLTQTIQNAGGSAYIVGGSVRDLVLGKIPKEFDLAVSLIPEHVQKIFKRVVPTGIKHGTVTVLLEDRTYELTTFRKDEDYKDGRRPESVSFGVTLSEDLRRRDFTMNALALDLLGETLVDEHGGLEDIRAKIIRTIGNPVHRFQEDGLRPVRAIRFVSSLGFHIHPDTANAIQTCRPVTAKVSTERIHDEFLKMLTCLEPSASLTYLKNYKILELFHSTPMYPDPDHVWDLRISFLSLLPTEPDRIRLAYFLRMAFGSFSAYAEWKKFFKELRFSNKRTKEAQFLCSKFGEILEHSETLQKENGTELRHTIRKILLSPVCQFIGKEQTWEFCEELGKLWEVWVGSPPAWLEVARAEWRATPPLLLTDLQINGNDILSEFPQTPPQRLGPLLQACLQFVLEFPEQNERESLIHKIRDSQI
ncbi:poly-A polymerase [Leptospira perolatii]|uniref:Poly-A polymerase n=1 Tax=Leptospira perolatii TaxID=2023191 RepID=A0A2M9ZMM3_9LEPT|nr:poly-A polymerase [Leptospira perolatii]PJZ70097.1 poly-A polymerase [Leptospira perolatii]PJZ73285.1 poly-A polymerase [Leptospira perolatii]